VTVLDIDRKAVVHFDDKEGGTSFKVKVDTAWVGVNYYNL
jgi:hypothetical protein